MVKTGSERETDRSTNICRLRKSRVRERERSGERDGESRRERGRGLGRMEGRWREGRESEG